MGAHHTSMTTFIRILVLLTTTLLFTIRGTAIATPVPPIQQPHSKTTIVVTGATGKVGSRVVRRLLRKERDDNNPSGVIRTVALVRNATKARSLFATEANSDSLTVLEADFADPTSLRVALSTLDDDDDDVSGDIRVFLACANGPEQITLETNVASAIAELRASTSSSQSHFCVKLSTAQPLVENSVGPGVSHGTIENSVREIYGDDCAMLRPNLFQQMLAPDTGGTLLGIHFDPTKDGIQTCQHMFATSGVSMIDCEDVAACAVSILLSPSTHSGQTYELTGPPSSSLSSLAQTISNLRPSPVTISHRSFRQQASDDNMPPAAVEQLAPFLETISSYTSTTDTVHHLLGRPPRSLSDYVTSDPIPFLPPTFRRLIASRRADSFRSAASVTTISLPEELERLEPTQVLVRVRSAGVNGGADTFSVTRASEDAKDFPLGHEGVGVVVCKGEEVEASSLEVGDEVVFVGGGAYGDYARIEAARCYRVEKGEGCLSSLVEAPGELVALRISALTALVALERTCEVVPGDVVLVTACCGGTGHFAVQISKSAGATVIGTVGSGAKVSTARALGVDRVVDLSREDLGEVLREEYPQGVDVAYEGVGGPTLGAVVENLADGGRVLLVGSISQYPHNEEEKVEGHGIEGLEDSMDVFRAGKTVELDRNRRIVGNVWGDLMSSGKMNVYRDQVYERYERGELRALVDQNKVFVGVDSVCDAVEHMLGRSSVGKVCVKISH